MTSISQDLYQTERIINETKAVAFDFDGVIADTEHLHALAYQKLLESYNVSFDPGDFGKYIGKNEYEIHSEMEHDFGIKIDHEAAIERRLELFLELAADGVIAPYPITLPLLNLIAAKRHPAYIVSSQRPSLISELLSRWSLAPYFAKTFTAYDTTPPRRKVDVLSQFTALTGFEASEVVYFEDALEPLKFAQNLGMRTVAVIHSLNTSAGLIADYVIDTTKKQG